GTKVGNRQAVDYRAITVNDSDSIQPCHLILLANAMQYGLVEGDLTRPHPRPMGRQNRGRLAAPCWNVP
ncbi:MAG: hypothetical protein ACYTEW_25195, partial [Planctomycetota bacterium]